MWVLRCFLGVKVTRMHLALAGGVSDGGARADWVACGDGRGGGGCPCLMFGEAVAKPNFKLFGVFFVSRGCARTVQPIKHTRAETPAPGTPEPRARRVSCELVVSPMCVSRVCCARSHGTTAPLPLSAFRAS